MVCNSKLPVQWKKVCVVGAGMAGLAAARELRREGHAVRVLEQGGDVGGQWRGGPRTGGLISPREAMGFTDFPFVPSSGGGRDPRRFPGHREVFHYLRDFCDAFGLMDAVRLNTRVLRVAVAPRRQGPAGGEPKWVVRSVRVGERDDTDVQEEVFDAVVVANGDYSQPSLPTIKGMEGWRRRQLHSHSYRLPEPFRGDVVVMVGCSDSGQDIALDLIGVSREVHLTAKSTEEATTPAMSKLLSKYANLHLHPQIEHLGEDGTVVFVDGSCVVADTVMYCTGYVYSFPFLETDGKVTVRDNRVGSLSFVGVPRKVPAPWFFEAQGKLVAQVLSGKRSLPPEEEMMRSVEEHYRAREAAGVPVKYTHELGSIEPLKYIEFGKKYCDFPRYEDWRREFVLSTIRNRDEDLETFRDQALDPSPLHATGAAMASLALN
uniref:Flavin-containing monooxygenase n=1 Tax=Oryza brachyantha TaxID=4533 RepID=J3MSC9_ORYBR